jgi:hypothetical protein
VNLPDTSIQYFQLNEAFIEKQLLLKKGAYQIRQPLLNNPQS